MDEPSDATDESSSDSDGAAPDDGGDASPSDTNGPAPDDTVDGMPDGVNEVPGQPDEAPAETTAEPSDDPGDTQPDDKPEGESDDTTAQRPTNDQPVTAPATVDVEAYTTDDRALSASVQVIWALRVLVTVAILGVVATFAARRFGGPDAYVGIAAVGLAVLALVWVYLRYRVWRYRVRADALYLQRGVLTRVDTVVPYVRIQHVDTQRGPLERVLGLSTLVVYTAGSRGADVSVPGLQTDEAADLQQRLKDLAIEAEGGDAL